MATDDNRNLIARMSMEPDDYPEPDERAVAEQQTRAAVRKVLADLGFEPNDTDEEESEAD